MQVLKLIKQAGERVVICYERPVGYSQQNSLGQDSFGQLEDTAFGEDDQSCASIETESAELDLQYEELAIVLSSQDLRDDSSTSPKHTSLSATAKSTGTVSPVLNRKTGSGSQPSAKLGFKDGSKQVTPKNSDTLDVSLQTNRQSGTAKPPVPPRPQCKIVLPTENQNTLETGDLSSEKPERPPPPANNGDKSSEKSTKNTDIAEEATGTKLVTNKQEVAGEPSDDLQSPKENTENQNSWESSEILYRNRLGKWARTKASSCVFEVEKHHKYLNIAIWCRDPFKLGGLLCLGHESLKLEELALDCIATSSMEYIRTIRFNPPAPKAAVTRTALRSLTLHKGFNEKFCYGDITVHFKYLREGEPEDSSFLMEKEREYISETIAAPVPLKEDPYFGQLMYIENKHQFQDTQFQNPTWCDYCRKKVWTKAASQCRICAYVCHKKCQEKCLTDTPNCLGPSRRLEGRSFKTESLDSQSMTSSSRTDGELKSASKPTGLTRHIINTSTRLLNLRQVPKTRFPEPGLDTIEPSPKHTPHDSDNEGSDTETGGPGSPSRQASGTGIKLARKEGGLDDSVYIAVKEIGRDLYRSLPTEERIQKLEVMLEKLQNEIDQELENNNSLIREEKETTDTRKKMLLSAALAKSGERLQALTLLMIHYRAGIEDIEALELESGKADKYEDDHILTEETDQEDETNLMMSPILETLETLDHETVDTPHESVD